MSSDIVSNKLAELLATRKPFPPAPLIRLWLSNRNQTSLYLDYLAGFRAIVQWLGPIAPAPEVPPVPHIFLSYTVQEIAYILNCSPHYVATILMESANGSPTTQS